MGEFVKQRRVIFLGRMECGQCRHADCINRGAVTRLSFLHESWWMWHRPDNASALLNGMDGRRRIREFDPFALLDVEHGVIAEENGFAILKLAGRSVLLLILVDLPQDALGTVLSFLDISADRLSLAVCQPVA